MKNMLVFIAAGMLAAVSVQAQEPETFNFHVQTRMPLEARTLKGAPYSAEVVNDHTQQLADGNRIVEHSTGRVYRDKEGRVRREEDRASGSPSISIVDPVAGVSYALDPDQRIAWKTPIQIGMAIMNKLDAAKMEAESKQRGGTPAVTIIGDGAAGGVVEMRAREAAAGKRGAETMALEVNGDVVAFRRSVAGEQHKEEGLPSRTMEGVRVEGRRMTTTIAAGAIGNEWPITIVSEEWTSPDLQVLVLTDRKDPRNGDSSYRLQRIARGEPAATLFQVPSDYVIKETGIRRFEYQQER
jgi:hypothetical protein